MIELTIIKSRLAQKLNEHIKTNRTRNKFNIDIEFENESAMFGFIGHWNFKTDNEDSIEICLSEAWVQFSDFTADLSKRDIYQIESYF